MRLCPSPHGPGPALPSRCLLQSRSRSRDKKPRQGPLSEISDAAAAEPISTRMHGPIIELEAPYVAEMVRAHMVREHGGDALTAGDEATDAGADAARCALMSR